MNLLRLKIPITKCIIVIFLLSSPQRDPLKTLRGDSPNTIIDTGEPKGF